MLNDNDSVNGTTIWCTHKAYSRGLLIQIAAKEKKREREYHKQSTKGHKIRNKISVYAILLLRG